MKQDFSAIRNALPSPVFDEHPEFIDLYWKAWDLAWDHVKEIPGMPQSPYMDEGFCDTDIWIWDTCFMALYCKYAPVELYPGYPSLKNFYSVIHDNGQLPEIIAQNVPIDGPIKVGEKARIRIHIADNPPLFAWAEYENAKISGNIAHIKELLLEKCYLQKHYDFLENLRAGSAIPGVKVKTYWEKDELGYHWEGGVSGMDNTPRGRTGATSEKARPATGELLWIDAICQQAMSANIIGKLFRLLGEDDQAKIWEDRFAEKRQLIRSCYWDEENKFFFDLNGRAGDFCRVKTIGSYWTLTSNTASKNQAEAMVKHLEDPAEFGGDIPLVSLSRSDGDFNAENGMYWRGSLWLPTAYATLKGCSNYGYHEIARKNTLKLLNHMYRTWQEYSPHTIWECYAPCAPEPGRSCDENNRIVREDFCGWSAVGPIAAFIEFAIGLYDINAFTGEVKWSLPENITGKTGVKNLRFGDVTADLIADNEFISVTSNRAFTLEVNGKTLNIQPGNNLFPRN